MQFAEGTGQALLDEIIRGDEVARQRPRIAPKTGYFGFDVPIRASHRGLLPMATIGRGADPKAVESIDAMLSDDVRASGFV
jgi:hypothetical protein